jgi:hypothetical protein
MENSMTNWSIMVTDGIFEILFRGETVLADCGFTGTRRKTRGNSGRLVL